jgi:phage-related protein
MFESLIQGVLGSKGFQDFIKAVIPLLYSLGQLLEGALGSAVKGLIKILPGLFQAFTPLVNDITNIVNAIAPLLPQLIDALVPVLPVIAQSFVLIASAVTPLIPVINDLVQYGIGPMITALGWLVKNAIVPLNNIMNGALKTALHDAVGWLADVLTGGSKLGYWIRATFGPIWTDLSKAMKAVSDWVENTFLGVWNDLENAAKAVGDWITNTFGPAWTTLAGTMKTVYNWVKNTFISGWNDLWSALKNVGGWIASTFDSIWNGLGTAMKPVAGFFESIWHAADDIYNKAFKPMATWITGTFVGVWSALGVAIGPVSGVFSTLSSFASSFWGFIEQVVGPLGTVVGYVLKLLGLMSSAPVAVAGPKGFSIKGYGNASDLTIPDSAESAVKAGQMTGEQARNGVAFEVQGKWWGPDPASGTYKPITIDTKKGTYTVTSNPAAGSFQLSSGQYVGSGLTGGGGANKHAAEGALITRPTTVLVGENNDPEVILPLNDPSRMLQLLQQAARYSPDLAGLLARGQGGGGGGGSTQAGSSSTASHKEQSITVNVETNANPHQIAAEVGWALRTA